ncbi:PASTA domain-containing protein [Neolewinella agarilytica]|uniref:D-alanine--D-alanine ligase n=1 Tax=Neolewinella agarilytica TaxID=478744 RepID=A0A1H9BEH3_9BACT|nr:PASTA domain-containing protein [Neolewinella agarilytica]SEP87033.1 D-alanine-D-alanine ligase [Neolewinella agarilytica]
MRIKVGIFFGGPSREREISFAGGRTVYDNLDKELFEPVPIFVDSFQKWHLLDWQYLYRGTIRDFFPPIELAPKSEHGFQVYQESLGPLDELSLEAMGRKVGRRIRRDELPELIDLAFLALHGEYGEDGQLQRELEYAGIPYTGSGVKASEIGMDKALQKELMSELGFASPPIRVIAKGDFDGDRVTEHFAAAEKEIGWPMVIRPARQGSSIGVAILQEDDGLESFERAVNAAFFRELLPLNEYRARDEYERLEYVRQLSDLRDGIAFPMDAQRGDHVLTLYTPDDLHTYLENAVNSNASNASNDGTTRLPDYQTTENGLVIFTGHQSEERVIVEGFIDGKEFSTIVVRTLEGKVVALPPTEIVKSGSELFDYRSKYMPGRSRKVTPIELPTDRIQAIREECERLYEALGFHVYARIDGFHTPGGGIYLNDPNTTSGMMPSSFFFHQAAEIGLNPSQFLTFIIRASLRERGMQSEGQEAMEVAQILGDQLDAAIDAQRAAATAKERIAVILGGNSFERHISVESGRNIYEKLASSEAYRPIPVFLGGSSSNDGTTRLLNHQTTYSLHQLPINLLLKDNADDIRDKLSKTAEHPVVADIRQACKSITDRFADPDVVFQPRQISWEELPSIADGVFIALHGRPGEDGQVQALLEPLGLYYNGSGIASSQISIDKHACLTTLREAGLTTTEQWLATAEEFIADEYAFYDKVERLFGYPLIAKPVDDGCSSAVKLIKQRDELHAYCHLTFRPSTLDEAHSRKEMKLTAKDEWPSGKDTILFEQAITAEGAAKFLEITGGMLTHRGVDGTLRYEVFEPSETLAGGEVLSLEEKFLAGEGQNLTPARLATDDYSYDFVSGQVKADLERAARAIGVEGYCRIDAFVRVFADGRVETVPIEINSLPGMTPATAIFHQAAIAGYQPAEFIGEILKYGKSRREQGSLAVPIAAAAPAAPAVTVDPDLQPAVTPADMEPTPAPTTFSAPAAAATTAAAASTLAMAFQDAPTEEETLLQETETTTEESREANSFADRAKATAASGWRLFKSGYFWKSIFGALLFFLLCFVLLRVGMNLYTAHGKSTELPNFVDMQRADAEALADDMGLKLKFEKGPFDPNRPAGLVVLQHPKPGAGVKKNRSIYLTILNDEAPLITLPDLVGKYDYTEYSTYIEGIGDIRSKIREQVYDPKLEENTIIHLFFDDRKITDSDLRGGNVQVPQGSTLEFVVSVRQTGEVKVPDLKCKRFGVVEFLLDGSDLLVGTIHGNVSDQSEAYVIRTEPPGGKMVPVGSKFDIYLSARRPDGCD